MNNGRPTIDIQRYQNENKRHLCINIICVNKVVAHVTNEFAALKCLFLNICDLGKMKTK